MAIFYVLFGLKTIGKAQRDTLLVVMHKRGKSNINHDTKDRNPLQTTIGFKPLGVLIHECVDVLVWKQ